jgi:hypothetical protein
MGTGAGVEVAHLLGLQPHQHAYTLHATGAALQARALFGGLAHDATRPPGFVRLCESRKQISAVRLRFSFFAAESTRFRSGVGTRSKTCLDSTFFTAAPLSIEVI